MNSFKKKFSYSFWTILAVSIGLSAGFGVVRGAEVAYKELGQPGKTYIASLRNDTKEEEVQEDSRLKNLFSRLPTLFAGKNSYTNEATAESAVVQEIRVSPIQIPKKQDNLIRIGWVGDMSPYSLGEGETSGEDPFVKVLSFLDDPDLMLANLEGSITEHTESKCNAMSTNCFAFKGDSDFLSHLSLSSIDGVNLANNHANDFGEIGYKDTKASLETIEMLSTGAPNEITYTTINDTVVALIGASAHVGSMPIRDDEALTALVRTATKNASIVIVMVHAGAEGQNAVHTPNEEELYLGENRGNIRKQAKLAIDAGAHAVFGSGPHVLRGIEFYNGQPIAYSLGNFLAHKTLSVRGLMGVSAILYIDFDQNGTFINGKIIPVYLSKDGFPEIDETSTAITIVEKLSREDFGDTGAKINPKGEIFIP